MAESVSSAIIKDPDAPPPVSAPTTAPRLSIPFGIRLPAAITTSCVIGGYLGLTHGSQMAGFRFRAENSHRLPTTSTGWYLYHKSKNYHMAFGGIKEAFKMGGKLGFWAAGFFVVEEAVDEVRGGRRDFLSTVVAGLGVTGGFSAWNRFPLITAARSAKVGLITGLAFGLVQDAVSLAKGRRLAYVDFILRRNRSREALES
ncbi:MAG: hypothetical protein FRX48_00424 [Lasallia pustulata]|uniref:Uncharacterized protein n=1 Tax=Lasallia pustulata TaxID=136370 RepID=A0A5M8Q0N3_9LECA|nr:MAG: hypothetical protein FRX48_00424 [Lasallia pustulata]